MPDILRRTDDMRIEKIEATIEKLKDDVSDIKIKIFNGFSHSIEATEKTIVLIDTHNKEDHQLLREGIDKLSDKFDKLLWSLVGVSFLLIVSKVLEHYLL